MSNTPTKPDEDDRIGPVGTAYTPIKLQPKKLVNPFAAREAQAQAETVQSRPSHVGGGAKKLTWSERQALAKQQAQEEEARSKAASYQTSSVPTATPRSFGGVPPPPVAPVAPEPEEEEYAPPVGLNRCSYSKSLLINVSYARLPLHLHLQQVDRWCLNQKKKSMPHL